MEFAKVVENRRSVRSYSAEKKVTAEQIEEILRTAQMAPTWKNTQTGRYYAAVSEEAVAKVRECLPEFNQNSSENAALVVTTFVKNISGFNKKTGEADNELGNLWGSYDLGCQSTYFVLKAAEMGLDTLIMGIRDSEKLRKVFDIPENEIVEAVIAVGYADIEKKFFARKPLEQVLKIY